MNIQTVIANLLNTIAGKEQMLADFKDVKTEPALTMVHFLKINLDELNNILNDCMAVREADIVRNLEAKDNTPPKGTHDYI